MKNWKPDAGVEPTPTGQNKVRFVSHSNHCTNNEFDMWRLGDLRGASRLCAPRRFRAPRASGASAPRPTLQPAAWLAGEAGQAAGLAQPSYVAAARLYQQPTFQACSRNSSSNAEDSTLAQNTQTTGRFLTAAAASLSQPGDIS